LIEQLRDRSLPAQIVVAVVVPLAFGALCGYLLGVSEIAYVILAVPVALLGGYLAGMEHNGAREGAFRGFVGGLLFGGAILLVSEATGKEPKADLPDPKIVLMAITSIVGAILGAFGGRRTQRTESGDRKSTGFDIKRIHASEIYGFIGAAVLAGSMFLPWFSTSCATQAAAEAAKSGGSCNPNSKIHASFGDFTAFQTFRILDILLLAACIAPFILAYIIARGHELTWRPGEVTMIVGMIAFALILLNGIILGRPGEEPDNVDISLKIGYLIGMLGALGIAIGGFVRQAKAVRSRKPPGVL
jgi:hypothetical protein